MFLIIWMLWSYSKLLKSGWWYPKDDIHIEEGSIGRTIWLKKEGDSASSVMDNHL